MQLVVITIAPIQMILYHRMVLDTMITLAIPMVHYLNGAQYMNPYGNRVLRLLEYLQEVLQWLSSIILLGLVPFLLIV